MFAYVVSFFLPLLINSTALLVRYHGKLYLPQLTYYPASKFGQDKIGEPDYRELAQEFRDAVPASGDETKTGNWVLLPPYPYSATESLLDLPGSPPESAFA